MTLPRITAHDFGHGVSLLLSPTTATVVVHHGHDIDAQDTAYFDAIGAARQAGATAAAFAPDASWTGDGYTADQFERMVPAAALAA